VAVWGLRMVVGELVRQIAEDVRVSRVDTLQVLPHGMNLSSK